jgi:hypothetical protein
LEGELTRDEALVSLANVGITKYRVTDNAAFFQTADGRRAKITDWTDDVTEREVRDLKAELSRMPATAARKRQDISPRTGQHIDRTAAIARGRLRAARKRARRAAKAA